MLLRCSIIHSNATSYGTTPQRPPATAWGVPKLSLRESSRPSKKHFCYSYLCMKNPLHCRRIDRDRLPFTRNVQSSQEFLQTWSMLVPTGSCHEYCTTSN
ncbi:hypothetical protein M758_2G157800 [Ceratodon purpureus]|nr:hypothetical protein M758_2G157800 [Ceratodon purpureus]